MEVMRPFHDADNNNILTVMVPAIIVELPNGDNIKFLKNVNGTEYVLATCHVRYPDDTEENINAVIWRSSFEKGLFSEGDEVLLRTQLEGEYAGNSVVEYANNKKVDIEALTTKIQMNAAVDEYEDENEDSYEFSNKNDTKKDETPSNKKTFLGCAFILVIFIFLIITARPIIEFFGELSLPLLLIAAFLIGSIFFNKD